MNGLTQDHDEPIWGVTDERVLLVCVWVLTLFTVVALGFMSMKLDAMHDDIDEISELVATTETGSTQP